MIEPENQAEWIDKASKLPQRELEREIAAVNPDKIKRDRIKPVTAETTELRCSIPKELESLLKRVQDLESQRTGKPATLGQCTHESQGRRCTETRWLEVHHIKPWSVGGGSTN